MEDNVSLKLKDYYYTSLLNSYIFSDDLKEKLKQRNIIFEEWFSKYLSMNIDVNYEYEIYGSNERDNCYSMLNELLFKAIEDNDIEKVELCNSLIRTLNISYDYNSDYYLESIYINSSLNPEKERKKVLSNKYDLSRFKQFFHYSSMTAEFLMEDNRDDLAYELIANDFYFNSVIDIINTVPEVLKDDHTIIKMMSLLYANDKTTIKGKALYLASPKNAINNQKVKKFIKKAYKNTNKENF